MSRKAVPAAGGRQDPLLRHWLSRRSVGGLLGNYLVAPLHLTPYSHFYPREWESISFRMCSLRLTKFSPSKASGPASFQSHHHRDFPTYPLRRAFFSQSDGVNFLLRAGVTAAHTWTKITRTKFPHIPSLEPCRLPVRCAQGAVPAYSGDTFACRIVPRCTIDASMARAQCA